MKLLCVRHVKRVGLTLLLLSFLCTTVLESILPAFHLSVLASPATTVAVDPTTISLNPGQYFTVNFTVTDITDLYGWQFKLRWPIGLLETKLENITEGPFLQQGGSTGFGKKGSTTEAYIDVSCVLLGAVPGVSGSGTLATATFKVQDTGNATLELYYTKLLNSTLGEIPHTPQDGFLYTTWPAAKFTYTPHPTEYPGHPLVNETVTFNATSSYDPDDPYDPTPGGIVSYKWDFGDENITTVTNPFITHKYSEPSDYTVILNVTDDEGESFTSQLSKRPPPPIPVQLHDITVINVTVTPTEVSLGGEFTINMTVLNVGSKTDTLNVTIYANMTAVETRLFEYWKVDAWGAITTSPYLEPDQNGTATVIWDTTGLRTGSYAISVKAFLVKMVKAKWQSMPDLEREEDMFDNGMFYGNVTIIGAVRYDLAVTELKVSPTSLKIDEWVSIEAIIKNEGTVTEQFNATITIEYESELTVLKLGTWSNQTLHAGTTVTKEHLWSKGANTTREGTYNITVEVQLVNRTTLEPPSYEDTDLTNNILSKEVNIYLKPIGSFTHSPTIPSEDETVIFNATKSYNPGVPEGIIKRYTWDFGDGTRIEKTSPTTTHVYRLSGTYTVNLTVTDNTDQTSFAQTAVTVSSGMAHILMDITFSPSIAMPGQSVSVEVTVRNVGYFEETFNLTAYYDENKISTETDITLECGANTTLTFTWDTTGVPHGYYTIKTVANKLEGVELLENTCIGGKVVIGMGGIGPTGNVTISASPPSLIVGGSTTINGSISPVTAGARVWIHFRLREAETWSNLSMVITDQDGKYAYTWKPQKIGLYALKSILLDENATLLGESGVEITAVKESESPIFFYIIIGLAAGLAGGVATGAICIIVFRSMKVGKGKRG